MKNKGLFVLLAFLLFYTGCSSNKSKEDTDIQTRYEKGMAYFEKGKYLRAQEEFNYVALSGSHTDYGDDALFYLGESYFLNKEYILARAEYDRLVRRMGFSPYLEQARWRICQCYVKESPAYYHDQTNTEKALEKLQEFVEDFPNSEYREQAEKTLTELRYKLGKKAYETGILYIKLGAYDSAILAFEQVLDHYYDTPYMELAHTEIIHSHCLALELDKAQAYYEETKPIIKDKKLHAKIEGYITTAKKKIARKEKE